MSKQHFVFQRGMSYQLVADLDHCYCPVCNHRTVITCEKEGCKCCMATKTRIAQWEKKLKKAGDWKVF